MAFAKPAFDADVARPLEPVAHLLELQHRYESGQRELFLWHGRSASELQITRAGGDSCRSFAYTNVSGSVPRCAAALRADACLEYVGARRLEYRLENKRLIEEANRRTREAG